MPTISALITTHGKAKKQQEDVAKFKGKGILHIVGTNIAFSSTGITKVFIFLLT